MAGGPRGGRARRLIRGEAPEPPFVGRDDDLRLVKDLLLATGRERRPPGGGHRVAGIGKSRLVWELQKYVDGLTDDVYWHQGRCLSYGEGVAFWAFAEMVRRRAGIADSDDAEPRRARGLVADLVRDEDERRWLEPRLGHLLGLERPGDREELFGAWRRYVERIADLGTTVLVFEDLHWADPGLLDFIESLLGGRARRRSSSSRSRGPSSPSVDPGGAGSFVPCTWTRCPTLPWSPS